MIFKNLNPNHRIKRIILYILSIILHPFLKIRKGTVLCVAYDGHQYSCNPRSITEYILENESNNFEILWLFNKECIPDLLDDRIHIIICRTIRALLAINTAEFVITNKRTDPWTYAWIKKKGQKYIMTWHGGKPLKKIEMDAIESLGPKYLKRMKNDSSYCDLFLSESKFTTEMYRRSFLYKGEILEKGAPRNDIFFKEGTHKLIKKEVYDYFGFDINDKIVLYAPTFRGEMNFDNYNIDWKRAIPAFEQLLKGKVNVIIRLHPNFLRQGVNRSALFMEKNIYDGTMYNNINDLMIAADVLISDYSSCMFDFTFLKRPVFLFATDYSKYDRGFYFKLKELPFPFSDNNNSLYNNIRTFDIERYQDELSKFMNEMFQIFDKGNASEEVVKWMKQMTVNNHA